MRLFFTAKINRGINSACYFHGQYQLLYKYILPKNKQIQKSQFYQCISKHYI